MPITCAVSTTHWSLDLFATGWSWSCSVIPITNRFASQSTPWRDLVRFVY